MRFARLSKLHVRNHFVTHITVFLWAGSRGRARVTPTSLPNSRSATQNPLTCRFIRSNVRWAQAIYAPSQQISKTSARQPIRPIAARDRFGTDNLGRSGVDMVMCCPATTSTRFSADRRRNHPGCQCRYPADIPSVGNTHTRRLIRAAYSLASLHISSSHSCHTTSHRFERHCHRAGFRNRSRSSSGGRKHAAPRQSNFPFVTRRR